MDTTKNNILIVEGHISREESSLIHKWVYDHTYKAYSESALLCLKDVRGGYISPTTLELMLDPLCQIDTWALGLIQSAGACLFTAGRKRIIHPTTELMFHFASGESCDVAEFMNLYINILSGMTGLDEEGVVSNIFHNFKSDRYMTAEEAFHLRLADEITTGIPDPKEYRNVTVR